ncbi:MAG: hypothetical protein RLY87_351 [Chloroflexota bacterium]|jgi:hypothetical protein
MNEQRAQMLERINEDEGLVGDLGGDAASALRTWAVDQAARDASSTVYDDRTVAQRISMIRTVARTAAERALRDGIDPVVEAQRQYAVLSAAPDTTMAIRTGPLRPARPVVQPRRWWQRLLFWRSK